MGLLDLLQSDDPAVKQGILQFGLGLLSSKGNFGNALGNAGQQGLAGALGYRDRQAQQKRGLMQDQLMQGQVQQMQRQQELQALPGQFYQPGGQPLAGPQPEGVDAPLTGAPSMDMGGYLTALQGKDPMQALQLQQAMAKPLSKFSTTVQYDEKGKGFVLDEQGNKKFTGTAAYEKPQYEAAPEVSKLIAARDALPPGHPDRKLYDAAISKSSTHQPATQVTTYGSPVPYELPGGGVGYVQPGNKPGAAPMVMTGPGGVPFKKPNDASTKSPTEFEAKAGLYFKSMDTASKVLDEAEKSNVWRPGVAESLAPEGAARTFATSEPRQKYTQAQMQWIDSINRVRSGANLPELEYARAVRTFFPVLGEGESIKVQKAAARKQEEQAMRAAAGKALPQGGAQGGDIHSQAEAILRGQ